jgi:hypothetical protein
MGYTFLDETVISPKSQETVELVVELNRLMDLSKELNREIERVTAHLEMHGVQVVHRNTANGSDW